MINKFSHEKAPEPNVEDFRDPCPDCDTVGYIADHDKEKYRNCTRCKGIGWVLRPLPANWRPRCIGCGVFLRRLPDGSWGNSCWDCYEDPWWG